MAFHAKCFHDFVARKGLKQKGVEIRDGFLAVGAHTSDPAAQFKDRKERHRQNDERDDGHAPILIENHCRKPHNGGHVLQGAIHRHGHHTL